MQEHKEIHTKGVVWLSPGKWWKQFDFLLFLKSWSTLTSLRATDVLTRPSSVPNYQNAVYDGAYF